MISNLQAFCGKKRSGKDFLLEGLISEMGGERLVRRLSFSDGLRDIAHTIYPWLPARIPDDWKDVPFVHPKNPLNLTPRQIWLHLGNDTGLRYVQPDIFLDIFIRNCIPLVETYPQVDFVISDVRTPQEYDWIKANQIKLIRISRADRKGIVEDKLEDFIDEMQPDHDFINNFDGVEPFLNFYRGIL